MIHINRAGSNLGIFSEDDVRAGLGSGQFASTDLGWREGMANWQPLSQFPELAAEAPGGAATPPPVTPATLTPAASTSPRTGLPWDERHTRGFLRAFGETVLMVLTRPSEAFSVMKREGGLGEPLIFALIGACSGALVSVGCTFFMEMAGLHLGRRNPFAVLAGLGLSSALLFIMIPFFVVFALFLGSAILHLCLMIVGGANRSFETTFRVVAFTHGSTGILQIIPICGGIIAGVWAIVLQCIGLARAHETDTGRAVLAVFLPLVVCCGGGLLLGIMFGVLGALGHHGGY